MCFPTPGLHAQVVLKSESVNAAHVRDGPLKEGTVGIVLKDDGSNVPYQVRMLTAIVPMQSGLRLQEFTYGLTLRNLGMIKSTEMANHVWIESVNKT